MVKWRFDLFNSVTDPVGKRSTMVGILLDRYYSWSLFRFFCVFFVGWLAFNASVITGAQNNAPVLAAAKITLIKSQPFYIYKDTSVNLLESSVLPAAARVVGASIHLEYSTYWP
ncbi:MAG: hypothetical protein ACKOKG_08345, partial [Verrucomicrobiota bacterium]